MQLRTEGILLLALPMALLWGCSDKPQLSHFESPESVRYTHLHSIYNALANWPREDISKHTFPTLVATLGNPDERSAPDQTGTYTAKWGNFSYLKKEDSVLIARFDSRDRVLTWRLNFIGFDEGSLQVWDHRRIEYTFDRREK